MRRNPMYGAWGEFYFLGRNNTKFSLVCKSGKIENFIEVAKDANYVLKPVDHEGFIKA